METFYCSARLRKSEIKQDTAQITLYKQTIIPEVNFSYFFLSGNDKLFYYADKTLLLNEIR